MDTCTPVHVHTYIHIVSNKSKQMNSRPRTYTGNFKTPNKEMKKDTEKIWEKLKKVKLWVNIIIYMPHFSRIKKTNQL